MKQTLLLIIISLICNNAQAMLLEADEIQRISDSYRDKPGTFALVFCCPIITYASFELLIRLGEKAPTPAQVKAKTASCCKRIKPLQEEFVKAHEAGILRTLLTTPPKQLKME